MLPAKIFLTLVALIYVALAIWCSADPATTSSKIGLQLQPGTGQCEFVTVYGGLEMGMALIFLMPLVWHDSTRFALTSCLLMHASLVLFRTIGYLRFTGIDPFIQQLAITEWAILLATGVVLYFTKSTPST